MKSIRNMMTLVGLSLALFALSATGAKAQNITLTSFDGSFTLPVAAQWGRMNLPAGEYTFSYGQLFNSVHAVEITGKADGIIHGIAFVRAMNDVSTRKDALVCVREGDALVVRALEMPDIGESVTFALPRGEKLMAHNRNHKGYTQLAEAPMLIERIPVTLNAR